MNESRRMANEEGKDHWPEKEKKEERDRVCRPFSDNVRSAVGREQRERKKKGGHGIFFFFFFPLFLHERTASQRDTHSFTFIKIFFSFIPHITHTHIHIYTPDTMSADHIAQKMSTLSVQDQDHLEELIESARYGELEEIQAVVEAKGLEKAKGLLSHQGDYGKTPLHMAAANGHLGKGRDLLGVVQD